MKFEDITLHKYLQKALKVNSYENLTPVQEKAIPVILQKSDVIAKAQTGSGKTAAFILPYLHHWISKPRVEKAKISALILCPTRELALQISSTIDTFSSYMEYKPKVVSVIGGQDISKQMMKIQKGCDTVVATSGRLLDIISKKQINLNSVEFFILDEADKMLDFGFAAELQEILKELPQDRQNLMFSATYSPKVLDIASKISADFINISIEEEQIPIDNILQRAIEVNKENRSPLLKHLLKINKWKKVLVFMSSRKATDNIAVKFRSSGFLAESFHGSLEQDERILTLEDFKNGDIKILFSSDIASRGLDIDDIDCVINYDLPRSTEDYIHRIGRTARASKKGTAISFVGLEDNEHFSLIQKRTDIEVKLEQIEGFELVGSAAPKEKGSAPVKGKRKSKKDKLREQKNI